MHVDGLHTWFNIADAHMHTHTHTHARTHTHTHTHTYASTKITHRETCIIIMYPFNRLLLMVQV